MLNDIIPKNRYLKKIYDGMDPSFEGQPIPLIYGVAKGLVPVCISLTDFRYKVADHEILSIDKIAVGDAVLLAGRDYIPDLLTGTFVLLGSPFLTAATEYFFVISPDWAVGNLHDVVFSADDTDLYPAGALYFGAGSPTTWTLQMNGGLSKSLLFRIYGKTSVDDEEDAIMVQNLAASGAEAFFALSSAEASVNAKFAQKFITGASGFYLTRITINAFCSDQNPEPFGNLTMVIKTVATTPNVQLGSQSKVAPAVGNTYIPPFLWDVVGSLADGLVDIHGKPIEGEAMRLAADIIEDIYVEQLDGTETDLDSAAFTDLRVNRPQPLDIIIDSETNFSAILTKMETGQLFKFLPDLAGQFTVKYITASMPVTRRFYDDDFLSFSITRSLDTVFQKIKISYGPIDPTTREKKTLLVEGPITKWLYNNTETLLVDTFLTADAGNFDAVELSVKYVTMCEKPLMTVSFEVAGESGFDLIPFQVVALTRSRADSLTGAFSEKEFVILTVSKTASTGATTIVAAAKEQMF